MNSCGVSSRTFLEENEEALGRREVEPTTATVDGQQLLLVCGGIIDPGCAALPRLLGETQCGGHRHVEVGVTEEVDGVARAVAVGVVEEEAVGVFYGHAMGEVVPT